MTDFMKCFEGSPSQSSITFKVTSYFSVAKKCSRMGDARADGFPGLLFSLSNRYLLWLCRSRHICQDFPFFLSLFSLISRTQTALKFSNIAGLSYTCSLTIFIN